MRQFLVSCAAALVLAWPSIAGNVSYVILHRFPSGDLVRVADDGGSEKTIATGVGGYGLAVDNRGDYIIARVSSLVRVTPAGVVSTIAACPAGSQWMAVAVDSVGNYIVGDNRRHSIWRVSPDGNKVEAVADYPVRSQGEMEDLGLIVDHAGNYLVVEGNGVAAHLWTVSPTGKVAPIPVHGEVMSSASGIVPDGTGAYLVLSFRDHAIFRITPAGAVTRFATVVGQSLTGLARNPTTGEIVATLNFDPALRKISADGSAVTEFTNQGYASAILAEAEKGPAPAILRHEAGSSGIVPVVKLPETIDDGFSGQARAHPALMLN
jgi:streptogramin lyase